MWSQRLARGLFVAALALAQTAWAATELRWKLEPGDCLLIAVEQSGSKAFSLVSRTSGVRTLYGADWIDGKRIATPPGNVVDLIYRYALELPVKRVGRKSAWRVQEVHDRVSPYPGVSVTVDGKAAAERRGGLYVITHELRLTSSGSGAARGVKDPRLIANGTLETTMRFHARKGLMVDAHVKLNWVDRQGKERTLEARLNPKELLRADRAALEREVDAALERALERRLRPYLKAKRWKTERSQQLGNMALILYAALKAGLDANDPLARAALAEIERLPWKETYSVSLAILALEASGMHRSARADKSGSSRARFRKEPLGADKQRLLARLARWLIEAQQPAGDWHYKSPKDEGNRAASTGGDNSNTQFAVLGLHAARRSDVPIPIEVWARVANHFLKSQGQDGPPVALSLERNADATPGDPVDGLGPATVVRGGSMVVAERGARARGTGYNRWGAGDPKQQYSSMSAAAVSSMLIAHKWLVAAHREPKLVKGLRKGIRDGYAWLQLHHDMRQNWPHKGWTYYHLYSLEKAFELGAIERIGGHDWWAEGARELLLREDKQRGGWGTEVQTALAVLFLTRASAEPELEIDPIERAQTGGSEQAEAEDAVAIDGVGVVRVSQLIAACASRDAAKRRERIALLERAWALLERERRPHCVPALARALKSPYRELSRRAKRWLQEIVGERVRDETEALSFYERWSKIGELGQKGGPEAIDALRALLSPEQPKGLRYEAARWLARLRAEAALGQLVDELERARSLEDRRYLHRLLISITGTDPGYDPEADARERARGIERWRAWIEKRR